MAHPTPVDSRMYAFAYFLRSAPDFPADFPVPEAAPGFRLGLFLPGLAAEDRPYAPRILLLYPGALLLARHPTKREPPVRISLKEILYVEQGHLLLQGWLRWVMRASELRLPFHTREQPCVDQFMACFREEYLRAVFHAKHSHPLSLGDSADLKFRNAEAAEMDAGEEVLVRFFSPAVRQEQKPRLRRGASWVPADLLALTGRRLLWITDRHEGMRQLYGTVTRYAPAHTVSDALLARSGAQWELCIALCGRKIWRIPVPHRLRSEAEKLVHELTEFYHQLSAQRLGRQAQAIVRKY